MKQAALRSSNQAFTILELLVVIGVLAILAAMVLPAITDGGCGSKADACKSNLKQVGLGLLMYASDHADRFPWQAPTNSDVTGVATEPRTASEYFLVLSNYAIPSSALVCPTDQERRAASNYANFNNSNLSYFVALRTIAINSSNIITISGSHPAQIVLAGDRNLSVEGQAVKPGMCTLNKSTLDWTKELHNSDPKLTSGSLLFADGRVQFVPTKDLARTFKDQQVTPTRLAIP